jgi:cell division protein FtsB
MGFLDKLKQDASNVAATVAEKTQEVAKSGQLQVQLRNLNGEERDAIGEFGREAYNLYEANALAERSGELAGAAAKIADLRAQIAAKEHEIAAVKNDGGADATASDTVESSAEEVSEPAAAAQAAAAEPAADAPPADNGATP